MHQDQLREEDECERKDAPIVTQTWVELVLEFFAPDRLSAGTVAKRVSRLQHLQQTYKIQRVRYRDM